MSRDRKRGDFTTAPVLDSTGRARLGPYFKRNHLCQTFVILCLTKSVFLSIDFLIKPICYSFSQDNGNSETTRSKNDRVTCSFILSGLFSCVQLAISCLIKVTFFLSFIIFFLQKQYSRCNFTLTSIIFPIHGEKDRTICHPPFGTQLFAAWL